MIDSPASVTLPADDNASTESPDVALLIHDCLHRDQAAFEQLYDHFAAALYRLCYGLLLNREDAEDVAQESFVYAFRNLHRFDAARSSFKTWLFTIAICRCRNQYRKHKTPLLDLGAFLQMGVPAPRSETPEAAYARQSAREALAGSLAKLSPRLREALVLRYGHGLTFREIAEVMDCPQKTAESRVRLAHEALRGMLQPVGPGLLEELLVLNTD